MGNARDLYARLTGWALALTVGGFVLAEAVLSWGRVEAVAGELLCLAAGAFAAAWAASEGAPTPRLAQTFVLASLVLLPPPGAALVAAAGCAGGRGGGVAGPARQGAGTVFAVLAAVAGAQFFRVVGTGPLSAGTLPLFAELTGLWLCVQGFAMALGVLVLGPATRGPSATDVLPPGSILGLEAVNVALAWIMVTLTAAFGILPLTVFGGLTVVAGLLLGQAVRVRDALRSHEDALQSRISELATLHAIGREVLSSVDAGRVFAVVDRECAKVFRFETLFIALKDRDTHELLLAYRRGRGESPEEALGPLGRGLASRVIDRKRGLRIDDLRQAAAPVPADLDRKCRSVLAVPLIVEHEAIGVLCLQSAEAQAYDDHLLSVLTTIAQQAAVAIENARHYEMATVDSLTGLFQRPYFFRRLEEEYARGRRYRGEFAVLMLDLDGFKEINDRHGHMVGDRYLRGFGAAVRDRLRGADLACRYGGDEFCLLLPETDLEGARVIAERIRVAVSELVVQVGTLTVRTTTSIGVAAFPDDDAGDARSLLLRADQALYRAKRLGRDRVVPFAA